MKINCLNCWKEIEQVQKTQKFCSRKCKDFWRHHHPIEKRCKYCGEMFEWNNNTDYCSKECRNKWWVANLKKWMIEWYWVDNPMKSPEIKEKAKQTCLQRMWVPNPSLCQEVQKKRKKTMLKKFNSPSSFWDKEVQKKVRQSMINNWWAPYPAQVPEILEKQNRTSRERHWGLHLFQTEEFKEKIKEINMQRDWVPYHCMTNRCKKASKKCSKTNKQFAQFLENNGLTVTRFDMPLEWLEYDIQLWNTLIEINPFAFHNLTYHPKNKWVARACARREELQRKKKNGELSEAEKEERKQISKRRKTEINYAKEKIIIWRAAWYKCITVFDWDEKEKILSLLKEDKINIYARKCVVSTISYDEAHPFLINNHLQWDTTKNKNNIYIGLFYKWQLLMVGSFWKPREKKDFEREILRLCTYKDYNIIWGASKIFKYFITTINPNNVVSYCDMSKFTWKVYEQLGFKLLVWNSPSKHWQSKTKQKDPPFPKHFTDTIVREMGFDRLLWRFFGYYWKGSNNNELMRQHGYVEVYDCWQATYVRHKEKEEK